MNRKLYLAKFKKKLTGQIYYKIGQCYQYDAAERFKVESEQYKDYDITIVASAWGPAEEVDKWEGIILDSKDKEFWINDNFSGVSELRVYTIQEVVKLVNAFKHLQEAWYKKRTTTGH